MNLEAKSIVSGMLGGEVPRSVQGIAAVASVSSAVSLRKLEEVSSRVLESSQSIAKSNAELVGLQEESNRISAEMLHVQQQMLNIQTAQLAVQRQQLLVQRQQLVAQRVSAAQLSSQTQIQRRAEIVRERQTLLKQVAFWVRQELDAPNDLDRLGKCIALIGLSLELTKVGFRPNDLEEIADKDYALRIVGDLTARLEESIRSISSEESAAIERLSELAASRSSLMSEISEGERYIAARSQDLQRLLEALRLARSSASFRRLSVIVLAASLGGGTFTCVLGSLVQVQALFSIGFLAFSVGLVLLGFAWQYRASFKKSDSPEALEASIRAAEVVVESARNRLGQLRARLAETDAEALRLIELHPGLSRNRRVDSA